ncbi:MAG: hydantoinase/oxoprolinase family protein [Gammaproteobacteria bacterium]|nr:hydantoinase/oxoprolinase family protein [Gammaproteobacteria bacterium]MDH3447604.1 hydantoinase/oxoprolinase family protein [Gammaproteobacteria bacterium]
MSLRLGIDTGGTFTDAVLVDDNKKIVNAEKSLTTRFDLSLGIGDVVAKLPAEALAEVTMVSLSTTLTTNSVVEDLGAPVCVLLPGYSSEQVKQSGLLEILPAQFVVRLEGGFDAVGREHKPLDEAAAQEAIERLKEQVSAFAISSMFGTRNSSHENRLKRLVTELTGMPVICGYELASSLGAPRRALTAALNARMVPPIKELILSVQKIMTHHEIDAPLMLVKGDGSLASLENAIEKPIGTVLSGPAASVIGACRLSGLDNAIVADMGGTTTDIAIVSNGQPELSADGANIGDWKPMVEAVRVNSIGLGGDSEIRFGGHRGLSIGPRRVVPTSLLAHMYPEVIPKLEAQLQGMASARSNRFVMRLENNAALLKQLNAAELEAWEALSDRPVELDSIVQENRTHARAMAKLKRLGLAIYSGFTPTDAVHVLGINSHWNKYAAELSARIWMRQMRFLYGYGKWDSDDIETACRQVYDLVTTTVQRLLVEVGLNEFDLTGKSSRASGIVDTITRMVVGSHQQQGRKPLFKLDFGSDYPIVAVGAPAASYYRDVADNMYIDLHLPEHGDVANAFGAVMGSIIQRAQVTVTQPQQGIFRLFHHDEPKSFDNLDAAKREAREIVIRIAQQKALEAGAIDPTVTLEFDDVHIKDEVDGELFLESTVIATAIGPACNWRTETSA